MASVQEVERFYSNDFIPDASRMLENRKGGITIDEGCLELIDNAEDAGSSETNIYLECDKYNNFVGFWILDNGKSMNSEELFNAVKLPGKDINRATDSIGKFNTGLKNATIGMGNDIYVVAKRSNEYRAIHMNIKNMQSLNTFRPTAYWTDEETIITNIYNKYIWDKFTKYESGTLICVRNIHPHISTNIDKLYNTLKTNIIKNYTKLKATLYINTILGDKIKDENTKELKIEDMFYNSFPDKIETCYETTVLYFRDKTIIEKLEGPRARGSTEIKIGTKTEPIYYIFKPWDGKKVKVPYNNNHIELNTKEVTKYLNQIPLATMLVKFVSVTSEAYCAEAKSQCDDDGESEGESTRRRGIYFMRGNRVVSKANSLGMNLDDYYNRLRMSVTYPPELDLELGCTTQKQINNLNSHEITEALTMIFKQCALKTVTSRKESIKEEKQKKRKESNKETIVSNKDDIMSDKETIVSNKDDIMSDKETIISNKDDIMSDKETIISNKDDIMSDKETIIYNKDDDMSDKETMISNKDDDISDKESIVSNNEDTVSNKEPVVSSKDDDALNKEDTVSNKEYVVSNKEDDALNKDDADSNSQDEASNKEPIVSSKDDDALNKEDTVSNKEPIVSTKEDDALNKADNEDEASNKEDNESTKEDDDKLRKQKKISEHITGLISGAQLNELLENLITKTDNTKHYHNDFVKFYNLGIKLLKEQYY